MAFIFRNFIEYFLTSQSQYFFRVIIKLVEYGRERGEMSSRELSSREVSSRQVSSREVSSREVEKSNEVELLRKLKHPNIIQLKGVFKFESNVRMIFEKCIVSSYF